tara:strand:- start:1036 stop:2337 length:1302 start_codon:yes stop_codon:yes gene_type:complete
MSSRIQENTVIEYPTGLSSIPFASFLEIQKFSYEAAQKFAAENFNDAFGSLGRSGIANKINDVTDGLAGIYGSEEAGTAGIVRDTGKVSAYQTTYYQPLSEGIKLGGIRKSVDINTADDDTKIVVNGKVTTVGAIKRKKKEAIDRHDKGLASSLCNLPLPNEFQYKYGAEWSNEFKLGTLALAADEAYRFGAIVGGGGLANLALSNSANSLANDKSVDEDSANAATRKIQAIVGGGKTAANPFKVNSELSPKNVAGLAGLAPNENSIQFFERMQGREFSFRFELASRSKVESDRIIRIIEWFKRGMHPGSKNGKGSAVVLTFPDVFVLTPKFVECDEQGTPQGDPVQHPMMPRTKLCALTGLSINTTPFGQMQTVFDGTIPIVTMELNFKETTKLTRVDMEGATFKGKANPLQTNSGVFTRDTSLDNTPEISF